MMLNNLNIYKFRMRACDPWLTFFVCMFLLITFFLFCLKRYENTSNEMSKSMRVYFFACSLFGLSLCVVFLFRVS